MGPRIRVLNPLTGEVWESNDLLRIGRNPNTDIQLPDRMVSRLHALLWADLSQWWIRDLQSRNGTRINGQLVTRDRHSVQGGDELNLGGSQLHVLGILVENATQWESCKHALSLLETLGRLDWTAPALQRKLRL
ncbi:MAG: FHA domain-containing protein [Gemmataceae bacterium]